MRVRPTAPKPAEPWVPPPGCKDSEGKPCVPEIEPSWTPEDTIQDYKDDDDDDDEDDADDDEEDEQERRQLGEGGGARPQHCGSAEQSCRGHDLLSVKQQRQIEHLAGMTSSAVPKGLAEMTPGQADRWLARHWELWRQMGHPLH